MTLFRDRVRERDLDNFLVEELFSSPDFLRWTLSKFDSAFTPSPDHEVNLEKSPARELDARQTDVRIGWFDEAGDLKTCVLVESKVTADFQPGQAEAYSQEAAALRVRLGQDCARCLLVAPSARLAGLQHGGAFDVELSLEEIIEFLEARAANVPNEEIRRRLKVRVQLLEALCGKRVGAGWIVSTISEKRDFAEAYAELAGEILPELSVRPSTDGPKAKTRIFEGLDLRGLPTFSLRHEFGDGSGTKYANIQFGGCADRVSELAEASILKGTPFTVAQAGKSAAIRVPTPAVDPMQPFHDEAEKVRAGLLQIRDLVDWLRANSEVLARLLTASPPEMGSQAQLPKENELKGELMATYHECDKLGYRPTGMLQMIENHGAIETARRLITGPPSEGYARLAMLGRLDLAVESIVQKEPWRRLFTDEELKRARARLR